MSQPLSSRYNPALPAMPSPSPASDLIGSAIELIALAMFMFGLAAVVVAMGG